MNEIVTVSKQELKDMIYNEAQRAFYDAKSQEIKSAEKKSEKEIYTNNEAMQYLGVSRSTLQRWRSDGILEYRKINGSLRYTKEDLDKLIRESKQ